VKTVTKNSPNPNNRFGHTVPSVLKHSQTLLRRKTTMPKSVVLFSGGLDSTTLLWSLRPNVKALLCNYGQRHVIELDRAQNICEAFDIEYEIANLEGINHLLRKGSQSGDEAVPEGHYAEDSMKTTIVPNRNMIMLSVAVGWALATGCNTVYYAAHGGDHAIYPDCRVDFIVAYAKAVKLGNAWDMIQVVAPFVTMSKADVVRFGSKIGVPFDLTHSCYVGEDTHCGKCGTCVERKEAFELAGVEDPTVYA
jgi:7-cyano-7-deazaguanine synthase